MKKIMSLFLAVCMAMGFVTPFVYAEEIEQESVRIELTDKQLEIKLLLDALGIMDSGYDVSVKKNVSKVIFAENVVRLMKLHGMQAETAFADSESYPAINRLACMGYLPAEKTTFIKPESDISVIDALKILLRALSLGGVVDFYENDSAAIMKISKSIGLIDGFDVGNGLSRIDMTVLLYNALVAEIDGSKFDLPGMPENFGKPALIDSLYDVRKISGTVTANHCTSLYKNVEVVEYGQISIDGAVFYTELDTEEFLGRYVNTYTVGKSMDAEEIIVMVPGNSNEKCYEISAMNIGTVKSGQITYYADAESDKERRIKCDNPIFVYNGATEFSVGISAIQDVAEEMNRQGNGIFRIITGGERDVIIAEMAENSRVVSLDKANNIVYVETVKDKTLKGVSFVPTTSAVAGWESAVEYVEAIEPESQTKVDIDDVSQGELLSLVISHDGSVVKIFRNIKNISGTVSAVKTIDGIHYAIINEKEYEVSKAFVARYGELRIGNNKTFLLDMHGRIGDYRGILLNGTPLFGYIYGAAAPKGLGNEYRIGMLNELKANEVLNLAKSVIVDGNRMTAEEAYEQIKTLMEGETERFVIYKTNAKGLLYDIDSVKLGENEDPENTFRVLGLGKQERDFEKAVNLAFDKGYRIFLPAEAEEDIPEYKGGFPMNKTTVVMSVATKTNTGEPYVNATNGDALADADYTATLFKYKNQTPFVEYVGYIEEEYENNIWEIKKASTPQMVNSVYTALNNQGEASGALELIQGKASYLTMYVTLNSTITLYANGLKMTIPGNEIDKYIGAGDIIKYRNSTADNDCYTVSLIYDYSEDKAVWGWANLTPVYGYYEGYTEFNGTYDEYIAYLQSAEATKAYRYKYESKSQTQFRNASGGGNERVAFGEIKSLYIGSDYYVLTAQSMEEFSSVEVFANNKLGERVVFFNPERTRTDQAYHGIITDAVTLDGTNGKCADRFFMHRSGESAPMFYIFKSENGTDK